MGVVQHRAPQHIDAPAKETPGGDPETRHIQDSIFSISDSTDLSSLNEIRLPIPQPKNICPEMKELPQWVLWRSEKRDGKPTKVPYHPKGYKASSNKPRTWSPFQAVWSKYQAGGFDGIGFVFSDQDDFIGVDLDHILDESGNVKESEQWVLDVLDRLQGSYTELSPSGDGLHVIVRGSLPEPGGNDGKPGGDPHLEIYYSGRYFTITGDLWSNGDAND